MARKKISGIGQEIRVLHAIDLLLIWLMSRFEARGLLVMACLWKWVGCGLARNWTVSPTQPFPYMEYANGARVNMDNEYANTELTGIGFPICLIPWIYTNFRVPINIIMVHFTLSSTNFIYRYYLPFIAQRATCMLEVSWYSLEQYIWLY